MDTKPWYTSRTIWAGALAMVVPLIGLALHVNITDAQTQEIATDLALIGGALGGLATMYGRIKATTTIAGTKAAQNILPQASKS